MLLSHSDFSAWESDGILYPLDKLESAGRDRIEFLVSITFESQGRKGLPAPIVNRVGKGRAKKSPLTGGLFGALRAE
ncbi:MAG: hypothetical protein CM15mP74_27890 [Halieaceae bacterium]|nr:MAG: hypothetical protein CM15mP74_27890 [Halieaceae bacterium]